MEEQTEGNQGRLSNDNDNDTNIYSLNEIPARHNPRECGCTILPKRYLVAILTFFGFLNVYALRFNLSVAIVAMVRDRTDVHPNGIKHVVGPEFNWSAKLQGFILSSFFYGYIITMIPGGYLASKKGGKNVLGFGILVTALLSLIAPVAARASPYLLVAVRILQGLAEGVTYPSMHSLWSKWAPPLERSKLVSISFSGQFAGAILGLSLSGVIADNFGWAWIFYTFGILGVFWSIFWFALVTDYPKDQSRITRIELEYILINLKDDHSDKEIITPPWKQIFTSMPVWAIIVAHITEHWGYYTLLTLLPTYLKMSLHFTLQEVGILSSLPYLLMMIVVQCGGQLADFARVRGATTTAVRKTFNTVGFVCQAGFLVMVAYTSNKQLAIVGLIFAVGLGGLTWSGFPVNHLDIAPRYAGILFGISDCLATIPGILSPLVAGMVNSNETKGEWRTVFLISSGFYAVGMLFYVIFASGEKQPWADTDVCLNAEEEMNPLLTDDNDGL